MTNVDRLAALKRGGERIVMVTAYDYPSARVVSAAHVDVVLVGDSAAMTVLGYGSTREVSLGEMLMLTRAVRRGLEGPLMIGDLPFGTYESSDALAVESARAFIDAGCDAVKLEGAGPMLDRVRAIVRAGIPVMGHVGLAPQQVLTASEYRVRGREADAAASIVRDARELERAGCFSLVVEAVPTPVTEAIRASVAIPVIGIGAGAECDGQVLVYHDLLGLIDARRPKFVREYASLAGPMAAAVRAYADDVRAGRYPDPEHSYGMNDDERTRFGDLLSRGV